MVKVYADGAPIYAPDLEGYELLGLTTTPSVEKAGTAEIVLPPDHPAYDSFVEYKTVIEIFRGDEMLFRGRALYPTDDMYRCRTITCEGERCFFRDSLLRPYLYQDTPANIFKDLVAQHNAQVDAFKQFRVGEITVVDDNDYVRLEGGSAETVAAVLDKLVGRCGGYIVFTTAEDGVRVINWYASIGRACSQMIEFGENLLDYSSTGANTNLATAILPYGAKNETSGLRTTIETVNSGLDYIQDDEAVARHGFIIQPVVWDDVTRPSNLLTKARRYLDTSKHIVTSLELTAVDLSVMDKDIETFRVGDWVPVYSEPHGVHSAFQLRERTYDLLNPANDRVVLGKDLTTLTGQTTALEDEVVLKAVELSTRIGQNKYNELDNLVKANSTAIEQTAEKIASKADQADYDTLGQQVSKNTSSIEQMAGKIESQVTREEFDALGDQVASNKSTITQTAKDIHAEVTDAIAETEAKITVEANKVRSEVSDDISGVESKIEQTEKAISLEVSKKLDEGENASGLDTGDDGVRVLITRDKFAVDVPDEDGDFQLDRGGARVGFLIAGSVSAPDVAVRYVGPTELTVNPDATAADLAAGDCYLSLRDACAALSGRYLNKAVTITVRGTTSGDAYLSGIIGFGSVTIIGGDNILYGSLSLLDNTAEIWVNNLQIVRSGTAHVYAGRQYGMGWARWYQCTFDGNSGDQGLLLDRGTRSMIWGCGLYNAASLLQIGHNADASCRNLKGGGGTNFLHGDGGRITWSGTRPDGTLSIANPCLREPYDLEALPVDLGTAQPSAPVITSVSFDYAHTDSYCGGWNNYDDDDVRQGFVSGKRIYGVIWFNQAKIRAALVNKAIHRASLRLHMWKGVGRGVAVNVKLYGTSTAYNGRSRQPELTTSYGSVGATSPGEINEITIPTQAVTDMANGTIQALVLLSDDTELYKDRDYSKNYARFSGSTSADASNCPRLTVNGEFDGTGDGGDDVTSGIVFAADTDGTILFNGTTFTVDSDENVLLDGATFAADSDGTILIE